MNLITNASDALGEAGGTITLRTGVRRGPARPTIWPAAFVFLEVGDTGCGMDSGTLQRIFDPFFSHQVHRPRPRAWPRSWASSAAMTASSGSAPRPARAPPSGSSFPRSRARPTPRRDGAGRAIGTGAAPSSWSRTRKGCARSPSGYSSSSAFSPRRRRRRGRAGDHGGARRPGDRGPARSFHAPDGRSRDIPATARAPARAAHPPDERLHRAGGGPPVSSSGPGAVGFLQKPFLAEDLTARCAQVSRPRPGLTAAGTRRASPCRRVHLHGSTRRSCGDSARAN